MAEKLEQSNTMSMTGAKLCKRLSDSYFQYKIQPIRRNQSVTFGDRVLNEFSQQEMNANYQPIIANKGCPICFEETTALHQYCCQFTCCDACWRHHIMTSINDGQIQIPCPSTDCSKYLIRDTILLFLRHDSILQERYQKLYVLANQTSTAKTCPRCAQIYSIDDPSKYKTTKSNSKKVPKQVQCSSCSLVWCFRCQAPWHENLTCKEFVKGDKLLQKWMKEKSDDQWNARKCPKCSSSIQRNGGCPHMTCSQCACEFCYLCGQRYVKIPVIGEHSRRYSIFGCPNNLYPNHPWRRRAIRGSIATGVVITSPLVLAGATLAGAVVLPPYGIYRLSKHLRKRYRARHFPTISTPQLNIDEPTRFQDLHTMNDTFLEDLPRLLEQLRTLQNSQLVLALEDEDNSEAFTNTDVDDLPTDPVREETIQDTVENNGGETVSPVSKSSIAAE